MGFRFVNAANCLLLMGLFCCQPPEKERLPTAIPQEAYNEQQAVTSLSGTELKPRQLPPSVAFKRDSLLKVAKERFDKNPDNEEMLSGMAAGLLTCQNFLLLLMCIRGVLMPFPILFDC